MSNHKNSRIENGVDTVTDNARSIITATADVAEEKVVAARNRLMTAIETVEDTYAAVQKKAIKTARAADEAIRDRPYQAIGLALGVGAVIGFLLGRRNK